MAKYGQWDGYLSGLGWDLILFLKNKEHVSAIKKNLHRLKNFHDSEELEAVIKENGFEFGMFLLSVSFYIHKCESASHLLSLS